MKAASVKIYYRDKRGVMRAIPLLKLVKFDDDLDRVYTLYPMKPQEIDLK